MNELALFAGAGGGILGGKLLGWRTVCAVEINAFCARRLMQRQNEGHLPPFPIWDDVCTFDGYPWRGIIDVVSGGFPCQDISIAGKGEGLESGERSGLWREMARIIREVRPRFAFVENSPILTSRGLGIVLRDLAEMGRDARWGVFSACDAGAPQARERVFIVGDSERIRRAKVDRNSMRDEKRNGKPCSPWSDFRPIPVTRHDGKVFCVPNADAIGSVDGMANAMDRLKAVGNGQVPAVVKLAWDVLT